MGSDKINNALVAGKAIKKTILIAQSSVCEKLFVELDACILLKFGTVAYTHLTLPTTAYV